MLSSRDLHLYGLLLLSISQCSALLSRRSFEKILRRLKTLGRMENFEISRRVSCKHPPKSIRLLSQMYHRRKNVWAALNSGNSAAFQLTQNCQSKEISRNLYFLERRCPEGCTGRLYARAELSYRRQQHLNIQTSTGRQPAGGSVDCNHS